MPAKKKKRVVRKRGKGVLDKSLIDRFVDNLPFELHIPGYSACGPGTKVLERMRSGRWQPKNRVDAACMDHDVAYLNSNNMSPLDQERARLQADREMLHKLDMINNPTVGERVGRFISSTAIKRVASGRENKIRRAMEEPEYAQQGSAVRRTRRPNKWAMAMKQARKRLGLTGFQPMTKGSRLYNETMKIYSSL